MGTFLEITSELPDHEIKKKGKMGDTPEREKGVYPWRM
jgi:hypothetical protein